MTPKEGKDALQLKLLVSAVLKIYVPELLAELDAGESNEEDSPSLLDEASGHLASELFGDLKNDLENLPSQESAESIAEQMLAGYGTEVSPVQLSLLIEDLLDAIRDPEKAMKLLSRAGSLSTEDDDEIEDVPPGFCELCSRGPMKLTFHHLIPRKTHKKMVKRGFFEKDDLNRGATICRPCHSTIHRLFDHEKLAMELNTVDRLLDEQEVQKWIRYAVKQKIREK